MKFFFRHTKEGTEIFLYCFLCVFFIEGKKKEKYIGRINVHLLNFNFVLFTRLSMYI